MINVAIVEDQKILREALKVLLEGDPEIKVVADFSNGRELIDRMQQLKLNVVLMDIRMPLMDGFETTEFLSKNYPDINILALTVLSDSQSCAKMISLGAKGYLPKDTGKKDLIYAIKKVAGGELYICPKIALNVIENNDTVSDSKNDSGLKLSKRELEILQMISSGLTNEKIGEKLFIDRRTVETHRMNLLRKTKTNNTAALIKYAFQNKLIN